MFPLALFFDDDISNPLLNYPIYHEALVAYSRYYIYHVFLCYKEYRKIKLAFHILRKKLKSTGYLIRCKMYGKKCGILLHTF